jgi:hypothetical protein
VESYSKPPSEVLETLRHAQQIGFKSGDLERAFRAWATTNIIDYAAGLSLGSMGDSRAKLIPQLRHYKIYAILSLVVEFRFAILHLTGQASLPIDWNQFDKVLVEKDDKSAKLPASGFTGAVFKSPITSKNLRSLKSLLHLLQNLLTWIPRLTMLPFASFSQV